MSAVILLVGIVSVDGAVIGVSLNLITRTIRSIIVRIIKRLKLLLIVSIFNTFYFSVYSKYYCIPIITVEVPFTRLSTLGQIA